MLIDFVAERGRGRILSSSGIDLGVGGVQCGKGESTNGH